MEAAGSTDDRHAFKAVKYVAGLPIACYLSPPNTIRPAKLSLASRTTNVESKEVVVVISGREHLSAHIVPLDKFS